MSDNNELDDDNSILVQLPMDEVMEWAYDYPDEYRHSKYLRPAVNGMILEFRIPIADAEKIGGCTVPDLVAAWHKAHPTEKKFKKGDIVSGEDYTLLPVGTILSDSPLWEIPSLMVTTRDNGEKVIQGIRSYMKYTVQEFYNARKIIYIPEG